jgi:hypothetical protein
LTSLLIVVIANFAVQAPYYFHQYGRLPSFGSILLMSIVFAWFLIGFWLLIRKRFWGYVLLLSFLIVECLFYLMTQILQAASGKGILLHVLYPSDPVLFLVFGVGYINLIASVFFIYYLIRHKNNLIL